MDTAFKARPYKPDMEIEQIMYKEGQRSVVEWARRSVVGGSEIHGEPKTFVQRLIQKYGAF